MRKLIILLTLLLALAAKAWATDVTVGPQTLTSIPFNPAGIGNDRSFTVTVTNASPTVTCSACFPASVVGIGGFQVNIAGVQYVVQSIANTSTMTLTTTYAATSGSATLILYKYVLLRVYNTSSSSFQPFGSTEIIMPGAPGSGNFYRQFACSIINSGGGNALWIPQFVIPATTDALITSEATLSFLFVRPDGSSLNEFYRCGSKTQLRIPPNTPTSFVAICNFNAPGVFSPAPAEAYLKNQIDARLPGCSINQIAYYSATGNALSCLNVGSNLAITSGTLNASTGSGGLADPGGNGVVVRTALGVTTARTITAGAGASVTNGDGVAGNPTIAWAPVTQVASFTLFDSSAASRTVTIGLSGANDPVWTFSDGIANLSTGTLQQGGAAVITGTVANTQVPVGNGANSVTSSSALTFATNTLTVTSASGSIAVTDGASPETFVAASPGGETIQKTSATATDVAALGFTRIRAAATYPLSGDNLAKITVVSSNNTSPIAPSYMIWTATQGHSATLGGTGFELATAANGGVTPADRILVNQAGVVAIAPLSTTITTAYAANTIASVGGALWSYVNTANRVEERMFEDPANGTNFQGFRADAALASDVTLSWGVTLPGTSGCLQVSSTGVVTQTGSACGSGGGGTTINPTNGVLPYRLNATTFADSNWSVDSSLAATSTTTARTSGSTPYVTINAPADTGLTASTEAIGVRFVGATRQHATGALTLQREYVFEPPTYSFVAASTATSVATVGITGPPTAGVNATFTNAYSLWLDAGNIGVATASKLIWNNDTTIERGQSVGYVAVNRPATHNGENCMLVYGSFVSSTQFRRLRMCATNSGAFFGTAHQNESDLSLTFQIGVNSYALLNIDGTWRFGDGNAASAQVHAVSQSTTRVAERVDSATNSTADLIQWNNNTSATSTVANLATIGTNSNGVAATGFGQAITFNLESSTTNDQNAAKLNVLWGDATHASRTGNFKISLVQNAGSFIDFFSIFPTNTTNGGVDYYFGPISGSTAGGVPFALHPASASGTNIGGETLTLVEGRSTGTAATAPVVIRFAAMSTTTGTALNGEDPGAYSIGPTAFTVTGNATVGNTTVETSLLGTIPRGDNVIGAGVFRPGRSWTIWLDGFVAATGSPTLDIKFKAGTTVLITKSFATFAPTGTGQFTCRFTVTDRTFSATGSTFAQGECRAVGTGGVAIFATGVNSATTTVDLTVNQSMDVTATWSVAAVGSTITVTNVVARWDN